MMQNMNFLKNKWSIGLSAILVAALLLFVAGCRKHFDQPPYDNGDPDLEVNATIADIKALYDDAGGAVSSVSEDLIFSAIVVSNDSSGNIYKTLYIEDTTGAINIQIDGSSLYATYPEGMRVFVKMSGLSVGKYNGSYQIGLGVSSTGSVVRIASALMTDYVVPGSTGHVVTPVEFDNFTDITDAFQSMLIKVNSVQFSDTTAYYADSTSQSTSVSTTLVSCAGDSAVLYTSGYASFAGTKVASGSGSITGIYIPYVSSSGTTTKELKINDLDDVASMTGSRCGTSSVTVSTIEELRNVYSSSDVSFTSGTVTGVVISNSTNESSGNVRVVQEDNAAGILLYVPSSTTTYSVGDKVSISLSGSTLTTYNGELELKNPTITVSSTGTSVTPLTTTIADILSAGAAWSTRLVKISDVTVATSSSGSSYTYYSFSDGSNSLVSYVRSTSGITLSAGTATVTGYVSVYKSSSATDTTFQLTIRTEDDVTYGSSTSTDAVTLSSSPLEYDLDDVADGLPTGFYVYSDMSSTSAGTEATFTSTATVWTKTTYGFYNMASATGLTSSSTETEQAASTDRALGVRQTGTYDNGVGFVFKLANTTSKTGLTLGFDLMSLDASSPRTMTWEISYATGDSPTSFTTLSSSKITGTLTTGGSAFSSNSISADLSDLDNVSSTIYVRIVAAGSSGSGTRPTSAIDNVTFTWQ
ncbi:MAG: DUF5689 domain-containing protein [Chitinophagaceae bacterium]